MPSPNSTSPCSPGSTPPARAPSRTSASASSPTEEVRRWRSDLKARGVVSEEEKREDCCYAVQDKFWLTDPDGNRWEVYTVLEDVEHASREAQAACCAR